MMGFLPGGARKRARRELEQQLRSIFERLDVLESTSAPIPVPQEVDQAALSYALGNSEVVGAFLRGGLELQEQVRGLEKMVGDLTVAVSEGIAHMERHKSRVTATIQRARKQFAKEGFESPALEAEAAELRLVDGDRSAEGEVPPLPEAVEALSSIRGVPAETLRRVRGF